MVGITINSFKHKDSFITCQLAEGSSINDLKAEIEKTEGIPVGNQRLVYDGKELRDHEKIKPSQEIIYLTKARIYLRLKQRNPAECSGKSYPKNKCRDKTISVSVDLDEPVHGLSELIQRGEKTINTFSAKLFVLDSDKRPPISITDVKQSFSSYGVCNGDSIDVIYESWSSVEARRRETLGKLVQAKFYWNGKIMHPNIKGLLLWSGDVYKTIESPEGLTHPGPGWLYGSPIRQPLQPTKSTWLPSFFGTGAKLEGFFPESFVFSVDRVETTEQRLEVTGSTPILKFPPLAPFRFPPATGISFYMPINAGDHSYLKLTAHYELVSCPTEPTQITMTLLFSTHELLRIPGFSMFIKLPHCTVSDAKVCEMGPKAFRRKVGTGVYDEDTIVWGLQAPIRDPEDDGLYGEESITFISTYKPVKFMYKCRVTYIWNGIEKTTDYVCKT